MSKKEDFFEEISKLANYCDIELVKQVYYGMVKVMSRQLRKDKVVVLPDWGKFYIHLHAARQMRDLRSGRIMNLGMRNSVKFDPDYKVKEYFKEM